MNSTTALLSTIRLQWAGTDAGLVPTFQPEDEQRLRGLGGAQVADLLVALADDHLFVKAHVLLTRVSGVAHESRPTWNGLVVELRADGSAYVDPAQRTMLMRRWKRWSEAASPPSRLPPGP